MDLGERGLNLKQDQTTFKSEDLVTFASELLLDVGLVENMSQGVAEILVEADLLGYTTHGLQLLASYLNELSIGQMPTDGEPTVLNDAPSALTWDGCYLPGPWLVLQAMDELFTRASTLGCASVVIRRSSHIGALAAYLKRATDRGLMLLLTCSDPSMESVAPHGAVQPVYTPNPIAVGYPTTAGPVWMDITLSTTTNGSVARAQRMNEKVTGQWLVDETGAATNDPSEMSAVLPLGGLDLGYKGFALGLLVEALTSGLGGFGRADGEDHWSASVFLLVLDPRAFGGEAAFVRETGWLAEACRNAGAGVRLPGERAAALREKQLQSGVVLHPEILPALTPWAERCGVSLPNPFNR